MFHRKWSQWFVVLGIGVAIVALCGVLVSDTMADKGGKKPGGGGGQPTGIVYFKWQGATWSMNADGSNKVALPSGVGGTPSHGLHVNGGIEYRWFLTVLNDELHAVREDGASSILLSDPNDGVAVIDRTCWAKDNPATAEVDEADGFVSYVGTDASGDHIIRQSIGWTTGEPTPVGSPTTIVSDASYPLSGHDWDPTGTQLVFQVNQDPNWHLEIMTVGGSPQHFAYAIDPSWSPDGTTIAFSHDDFSIGTIKPDGSDLQTIIKRDRWSTLHAPKWAPSNAYLVYLRWGTGDIRTLQHGDVYRATADGKASKNLTADIEAGFYAFATPLGWR